MNSNSIEFKTADNKTVEIAEWVVNKNADSGLMTDLAFGTLEIARETEKAVLFKGTFNSFWAPKSQLTIA